MQHLAYLHQAEAPAFDIVTICREHSRYWPHVHVHANYNGSLMTPYPSVYVRVINFALILLHDYYSFLLIIQ